MSSSSTPPTDTIPRDDPDLLGAETESLAEWLDYHRATVQLKCSGLTEDQLKLRPLPSSLSLLGLLRHLTEVERNWFARMLAGRAIQPLYSSDDDPDGDFDSLDVVSVAEVRAAYQDAVAEAREIYRSFASPDDLARGTTGRPRNVRWVMLHMIEEYARHNGHADLLREAIDGTVGE